jgi:trk system potassium uptake protein TrkH
VTISLMFVGGAAGSTAGGIKLQTFSILYFAIVSAVRGFREVEAFRRQVPMADVLRAIAVALLSLALIFVVTFALTVSERFALLPILFETFSAFGTVGLSTGITPDLSPVGRVILILTMFAGRLGPLTLVLALAARERRTVYHWPEEAIKIG